MNNILIIGGSSGIGKELAYLEAISNQVYATYHTHELANSSTIKYFHVDVLQETIDLNFLPDTLDGLVYCPGSINLKPFARLSSKDFVNDYTLNVVGAVNVIQSVLPKLKKSRVSSIVLFSTVAVQTGLPFHSLVSSSKGAIEGLTKALAAELAPSIRVNCIAPSLTDTPLASMLLHTPEKKAAADARHPLKRVGTAKDIAELASYLLSEKSSWMTGQILHLDGGMSSLK